METHTIKVTKYTDWTYRLSTNELVEDITKDIEIETIFKEIKVNCRGLPEVVWKINKRYEIGFPATVTIFYESGCDGVMTVILNGEPSNLLLEGDCESFTVEHLRAIEIECDGEIGDCIGLIEITFHLDQFINWLHASDIKSIICDHRGHQFDSPNDYPIHCHEIPQEYERETVDLTLPDWNTVTLQKVQLVKVGYVAITFLDGVHRIFTTSPVPIQLEDKVLLTAPEGTKITCEILDVDCSAIFVQSNSTDDVLSNKVKITITIYQCIMVDATLLVKVEGRVCKPRMDNAVKSICPPHKNK
ncbi:S-Ena type endospore appendage [Ferdinandcohnia quinoae]|uniref:DUF3992 domain-containing protein n=1 Tax=Fredinandcohnia quinoae TaxID=2918902 RepID=A0AAW5E019_9BACI|nr:S-Ena type endospore appendage [Fredinandcohnia sp. SECRCQ15]MCH1626251.1 DUF3992 domain-containing protein [Fredinandcohnia sp. SECRCQ15]